MNKYKITHFLNQEEKNYHLNGFRIEKNGKILIKENTLEENESGLDIKLILRDLGFDKNQDEFDFNGNNYKIGFYERNCGDEDCGCYESRYTLIKNGEKIEEGYSSESEIIEIILTTENICEIEEENIR